MESEIDLKFVDDNVSISYSNSDPVFEKLCEFKGSNLFCDIVLQAKKEEDRSMNYRKKLRNSTAVKAEKKVPEKWAELPVHSCIIAAGSDALKYRLQKIISAEKDTICCIHNVNMKYLRICIDFVYRKFVTFKKNEVKNVFVAAKALGIHELQRYCKIAMENADEQETLCSGSNINENSIEKSIKNKVLNSRATLSKESLASKYNLDERTKKESFPSKKHQDHESIFTADENDTYPCDAHSTSVLQSSTDQKNLLETDLNDASAEDQENEAADSDNEIADIDFWENVFYGENSPSESNNGSDSEPAYLGNPPPTTNCEMEKIKLYTCFHCKEDFSLADHYCDVVKKDVRLRIKFCCHYCGLLVSSRSFSRHVHLHLQNKKFKCDKCDFAAVVKFRLVNHQRKHSDEKGFKCKHCDRSYKFQTALREHLVVKHNIMTDNYKRKKDHLYQCPECDFRCSAHAIAVRHAKSKHPTSDSIELKHFIDIHTKLPSQKPPNVDDDRPKKLKLSEEIGNFDSSERTTKLLGGNSKVQESSDNLVSSSGGNIQQFEINTLEQTFNETTEQKFNQTLEQNIDESLQHNFTETFIQKGENICNTDIDNSNQALVTPEIQYVVILQDYNSENLQ